MKKILILVIFFTPFLSFSQKNKLELPVYTNVIQADNGYMMSGIIIEGDTFPLIKIYRIIIFPERKFTTKKQKQKYDKLTYNIKVVYPFAVLIGDFYNQIQADLEYIPESEHKKYLKKKEKELRDQYEETLIDLTITQGRLLIKLVDRQTTYTTFDVIEQFKGEMSAYFWQSLAYLFGTNLKSEYDPVEEDKLIEEIIAKIENGQI